MNKKMWMVMIGLMLAGTMTACGSQGKEAQNMEESREVVPQQAENIPEDVLETGEKDMVANQNEAAVDQMAPQESESGTEKAQLYGDVVRVGDGTIVINKIDTMTADDGGEVAIAGVGENERLITVYYHGDTVFKLRTATLGADNYGDETEASKADVIKGDDVTMEGQWKEEDFYADKIVITRIV